MLQKLIAGCAVAALCAAAHATVTIDPPGADVVTPLTANGGMPTAPRWHGWALCRNSCP